MKLRRITYASLLAIILCLALNGLAGAADTAVAGWDPETFRQASTIEIMTTEPDVGEHWSKLWVVVIDDQPYVRLGTRSYGRVQRNTTSPYVKLKVGDQEFDKVKLEEMSGMKDKVAAAMADKYFLDRLIRYESHPTVARLIPEASAPAAH
jgi:hypothetical protein